MKKYTVLLLAGMLVAVAACGKKDEAAKPADESAQPMAMQGDAQPTGKLPPGHPEPEPADTNMTNTAKILEVIDAPPYSYLHVSDDRGTFWLAGMQGKFTKGATVKYSSGIEMKGFHSKTLDRTFDSVVFIDAVEQVQ
ncbi:MAG: hypothetical protein LBE50_00820 [Gallionellaceae bacterium]|nr:hypothetical protein [Gallionellaceae bacterium]